MNSQKNYYETLGVLKSADEAVIRAAYKALAQKYHPDKNPHSTEESYKKFIEIQEAYEILSHKEKRKAYDSIFHADNFSGGGFFDDTSTDEELSDPLINDWLVASKYYPNLIDAEEKLSCLSKKLSYAYKAYILKEKLFNQCLKISEDFEKNFLKQFFGDNREILAFARYLIFIKNKAAIKDLNEAIRVLGENHDPKSIIKRIYLDHNLVPNISTEQKKLIENVRSGNWAETKRILEKGVHANHLHSENGETLIEIARQRYDMPMINLLQSHGIY